MLLPLQLHNLTMVFLSNSTIFRWTNILKQKRSLMTKTSRLKKFSTCVSLLASGIKSRKSLLQKHRLGCTHNILSTNLSKIWRISNEEQLNSALVLVISQSMACLKAFISVLLRTLPPKK